MKKDDKMIVKIANKETFTEKWYEGSIIYQDKVYQFWMIDPEDKDLEGNSYEPELRWFFKDVPRNVRKMYNEIVQTFKDIQNDKRTNKNRS